MIPQDKENLYRLFRFHANVIGAARMTIMSIKSIINAVSELKCDNDELIKIYDELSAIIKQSEPKIIPLIHLLELFEAEIKEHHGSDDTESLRDKVLRLLNDKIDLYESKANSVTRYGLEHVTDGDTIIVHSASSVVTNILVNASRIMRCKYKVVILQLDPVRTPQVAKALEEADIQHTVIPEYNLCHYLDEANKLFIGALTVTKDNKIVAPVGTANVLGLCYVKGIKSYLFANSLHYSHGLATSQKIHKEQTDMIQPMSTYCLTTYSHDLVQLDLLDIIINEDGVVPLEK